MSAQNLKFIHLASTAAATDKVDGYAAGSIIFEPKSGRIAVQGTNNLEYYGGGRIADAEFDTVGKVLTLSFNDGSDAIKLDFSDTASATGVNKILGQLRTDVNALKTTVGDASNGLVKKVNDNATAITALQRLHADNGVSGKKTVAEEVTAGVNAKVGDIKIDGAAVTVKAYVDAGDAKALADAKKYTDDEVKKVNTDATALGTRVTTLETKVGESTDAAKADGSVYARIAKNAADIATLVGRDTGKSARTIANEELAAQLIPENAKDSLDTLQEIAAWIQAHPDDASKMNGKIAALETKVGDEKSGLVKKANDNATAITALQGLHESGKKVADEVTDGINKIAEKSASNDAESDVVVTVTTEAGSVKTVAVDASGLRDDLGQKTAAAAADTAFGRIKALETTVSDPTTGLVKKVADNTTNIGANTAAIKVLQDAQAAGSLMWSSWAD